MTGSSGSHQEDLASVKNRLRQDYYEWFRFSINTTWLCRMRLYYSKLWINGYMNGATDVCPAPQPKPFLSSFQAEVMAMASTGSIPMAAPLAMLSRPTATWPLRKGAGPYSPLKSLQPLTSWVQLSRPRLPSPHTATRQAKSTPPLETGPKCYSASAIGMTFAWSTAGREGHQVLRSNCLMTSSRTQLKTLSRTSTASTRIRRRPEESVSQRLGSRPSIVCTSTQDTRYPNRMVVQINGWTCGVMPKEATTTFKATTAGRAAPNASPATATWPHPSGWWSARTPYVPELIACSFPRMYPAYCTADCNRCWSTSELVMTILSKDSINSIKLVKDFFCVSSVLMGR